MSDAVVTLSSCCSIEAQIEQPPVIEAHVEQPPAIEATVESGQGPAGPGGYPSADEGNEARTGSDGGIFVPYFIQQSDFVTQPEADEDFSNAAT